jgi:thiaminase
MKLVKSRKENLVFYKQLEKETEAERQYLLSSPIIEDVMLGRFNLNTYIAFLHQAYHHVKHTAPLLMAAGSRLSGDQVGLQRAVIEYTEEEAGHDEWILDDLAVCGVDRDEYHRSPPTFESEVMVSYLYDVVHRANPVGIFGMVLVLEGTSAGLATEVASLVQQKLSLPDKAFTYLASHGELDKEHLSGFEVLMDSIVDERDQAAIVHTAKTVYRLYGNVYRAIPEHASALDKQAAA